MNERFLYSDDDCPEIKEGNLSERLPEILYIIRNGVELNEEETEDKI